MTTVVSPVISVSIIGATGTAMTVTLPAGISTGFIKVIVSLTANINIIPGPGVTIYSNSEDVTALTSTTGGASVELLWTGTNWMIISNLGFAINQPC